ncbi:hypothetical protein H8356DRAFT_1043334 [Neocallimastix lanati (nom. inval.)]|nr:hypothetical protein H8356DRAFT_1043334 [Neocallimastix sp. JGI-2020a]
MILLNNVTTEEPVDMNGDIKLLPSFENDNEKTNNNTVKGSTCGGSQPSRLTVYTNDVCIVDGFNSKYYVMFQMQVINEIPMLEIFELRILENYDTIPFEWDIMDDINDPILNK